VLTYSCNEYIINDMTHERMLEETLASMALVAAKLVGVLQRA
jgi:hypothetical protein